jgi:hypothetical protein
MSRIALRNSATLRCNTTITVPIILSYLKGGKDHLSHVSLLFGPDHYNQKDHLEANFSPGMKQSTDPDATFHLA